MMRRDKVHRRGRRAVVSMIVAFAASQLAIALAIETIWPVVRNPALGARLAVLDRKHSLATGEPLILALGGSRVETGLQPSSFADSGPGVFNFGLAGQAPLNTWLTMQHLESRGVRPAGVILELMPGWLVEPRPAEECVLPERLTRRDLLRLTPECTDAGKAWRRWLEGRLLPIHSCRYAIVSRLAARWLLWDLRVDYLWANLDEHGANRLPDHYGGDECRERGWQRAIVEYAERLRTFRIDPLPDRMIRRILDECRERDIPVLLLVMPESPAYRRLYPPDALRRISDYTNTLQSEYRLPLIDARSWLPESAFVDGHHLLESGARQFSLRFGRESKSWRESIR